MHALAGPFLYRWRHLCSLKLCLLVLGPINSRAGPASASPAQVADCKILLSMQRLHDTTPFLIKNDGFEFSISGDQIRRANEEAESKLRGLGVVFREVPAASGFAMSYLDKRLPKDHPLGGLVKVFEIVDAGQNTHGSLIQDALSHRGLSQKIKEANDLGATFMVDSSSDMLGTNGYMLRMGTEIRLSHKASFSTVEHELSHLRFFQEVQTKLFNSGLFARFVDEYDRYLEKDYAKDPRNNDLPFYPQVSDHLDVDPERERVLKIFAEGFSSAERKKLLKEKNVLGYFLRGIQSGHIHIGDIDEISATGLQKGLLREEQISALHFARLSVHDYQLIFKIRDLENRKQLSVAQKTDLIWMKKQRLILSKIAAPLMYRYGDDVLVRWYQRAIESAPLGVFLLLSGSSEQEEEMNKAEKPKLKETQTLEPTRRASRPKD